MNSGRLPLLFFLVFPFCFPTIVLFPFRHFRRTIIQGSINQQQEASQCTACTPGTYSNTAGTYCQQASAGSHVPEYNSSAQIPCKPGYHSPNSVSFKDLILLRLSSLSLLAISCPFFGHPPLTIFLNVRLTLSFLFASLFPPRFSHFVVTGRHRM